MTTVYSSRAGAAVEGWTYRQAITFTIYFMCCAGVCGPALFYQLTQCNRIPDPGHHNLPIAQLPKAKGGNVMAMSPVFPGEEAIPFAGEEREKTPYSGRDRARSKE